MDASPLASLVSSTGLFYVLFLPLMAIQLFALLAIPGMLKPGVRASEVGKALLAFSAQTVGILLMTVGGLPTAYTVLASQPLSSGTYTALLFIFAIGGLTYLWHDAALRHIDPAAKSVPQMIFGCAWKFVGLLIVLCSLLSLLLRLALEAGSLSPGWWIMHLTFIVYGLILTYASLGSSPAGFRSQAMAGVAKIVKGKKK